MPTTLKDKIRKTTWELIGKGINDETPVINPFKKSKLTFNYSKINKKYHASQNPDDLITLYKGARIGYENQGFVSMALRRCLPEHIIEVKEIIEKGDDSLLDELFDEHISYYSYTGLLSATFNPETAQGFATTHPIMKKREPKTIYQIKLKANRCVFNYHDTGHCGHGKEILALGAIFPEEISAVKIINDDSHSELMSSDGRFIRHFADKNSQNTNIKDSTNWHYLNTS
jgi:hypothetical protein